MSDGADKIRVRSPRGPSLLSQSPVSWRWSGSAFLGAGAGSCFVRRLLLRVRNVVVKLSAVEGDHSRERSRGQPVTSPSTKPNWSRIEKKREIFGNRNPDPLWTTRENLWMSQHFLCD